MLTPKRLSTLDDTSNLLQIVVFSLADIEQTSMSKYLFALPVEAVEKAIVYPPDRVALREGIGMMNIAAQTVTIVDLRHKFTKIDSIDDSSKFLILFHTNAGELCGLPVKNAPEFLEIEPTMIRSIPLAYREVNQLSFVTQMAVIPQPHGREPLQILLLGM